MFLLTPSQRCRRPVSGSANWAREQLHYLSSLGRSYIRLSLPSNGGVENDRHHRSIYEQAHRSRVNTPADRVHARSVIDKGRLNALRAFKAVFHQQMTTEMASFGEKSRFNIINPGLPTCISRVSPGQTEVEAEDIELADMLRVKAVEGGKG